MLALQFTGEEDNVRNLVAFTQKKFELIDERDRGDDPDCIAAVFDTLHSTWVGVKLNQWIIQGVKGEYYPCDDEVFQQTYEPVK